MSDKIQPKTLPGFLELLPDKQILFNQMLDTIRNTYERFGFLPLDTPIVEAADVLLAKAGGETEKQIYKFNKGENDLVLRFDLTVPLAKYVAQYYHDLSFPFRRYQIGKVYRGEKPQKGRFREFYQCDIDIIGDNELNILNDAEIPSVIYNTFKNLGFDDFTICINNRKILSGFFESLNLQEKISDILRIIDKLEKIGPDAVKEELLKIDIDASSIAEILEFTSIDGTNDNKIDALEKLNISNALFNEGLSELKEVARYIQIFGVPEKAFKIDLTIARGLDYYTGTVYETFLNDYKSLGSICSGGRYDNLAEYYTDKKLPGVGISIGLSRLFYKLNEMALISANKSSIADILIIPMIEDMEVPARVATELRNAGINTEVYVNTKNIKGKFNYANKLKVPYVLVVGEDEIKNNMFSLKNMDTGEQKLLSIQEIINVIKLP